MGLVIPVVLAMLVGALLKRHPDVSNKLIPALIFVSQFVGRLLLELGVGTAQAGVLGALGHVVGVPLLNMLAQAAMATLVAVGTHSVVKNSREGVDVLLDR